MSVSFSNIFVQRHGIEPDQPAFPVGAPLQIPGATGAEKTILLR
jgi:hypothetical protein